MKTKLTVQKEIAHRNKIFKTATQREKRVLVAQDVLDQIELGRIIPASGVWVAIQDNDSVLNYDDSIQEKVIDNTVACECCGVGSLLLSCTLFKNRITVDDQMSGQLNYCCIENGNTDKTGIRNIFEPSQLRLIELAFEGGDGYCMPNIKQKDGYNVCRSIGEYVYFDRDQRAIDFGKRYKTDSNRLKAIMTNIVKNNGTFIP